MITTTINNAIENLLEFRSTVGNAPIKIDYGLAGKMDEFTYKKDRLSVIDRGYDDIDFFWSFRDGFSFIADGRFYGEVSGVCYIHFISGTTYKTIDEILPSIKEYLESKYEDYYDVEVQIDY